MYHVVYHCGEWFEAANVFDCYGLQPLAVDHRRFAKVRSPLTAYPVRSGASVNLIRLFCRIAYVHYVGIDDYFMVAAWVVTTGMGIMNVFHISWGTGSGPLNAA